MDYNIFPVRISTRFKKIQRKKSRQAACRRHFYYVQRCSYFSESIRNTWSYVQHTPMSEMVLRWILLDVYYLNNLQGAIGYETSSKFQNLISLSVKNRSNKAVDHLYIDHFYIDHLYIDHYQSSRYRDLVKAWKIRGCETQPVCSLGAGLLS
jgi:hypothetical protein